jgi:tRNA pseudouridine55 synthase
MPDPEGRMTSGVLLIDKPCGPTSHDVVARLRRSTGERRIGHTGTLDPRATGLLALVLGQATRLASLLTGSDKTYEAAIRLGFATDTDDAEGTPIGNKSDALPDDAAIESALQGFVGVQDQRPPAYSAKKIAGRKAYELARSAAPVELAPAQVTVHRLAMTGREADLVRLTVRASSGFYVRALARDLGERLGCFGHLDSLRRTEVGPWSVRAAVPLAEAERLGREALTRLIAPSDALPDLAAVRLTPPGLRRVMHGNAVGPEFFAGGVPFGGSGPVKPVKLLDAGGRLVALAHFRGGALHPVVVLG